VLAGFAVEPSAPLFENDSVKIVRALEKAHVKGGFHEHKPNRVMVYLQSGKQRFEYQNGRKPAEFDWKAGQVVWSPADGMHSPEVISDQPFNIIEVELKKAGGKSAPVGAHDALKADPKHYKLEFENDQVRVLRMTLGAHESTPQVTYSRSAVEIFLTNQGTHKAGEAIWVDPGMRNEENTGASQSEAIIVEVKG